MHGYRQSEKAIYGNARIDLDTATIMKASAAGVTILQPLESRIIYAHHDSHFEYIRQPTRLH